MQFLPMDDSISDPLALLWETTAQAFEVRGDTARGHLLKICLQLVKATRLSEEQNAEAAARLAADYADRHGLRLFWRLPDADMAPFSADPLRESEGAAAEQALRIRLKLSGTPLEAALDAAMKATADMAAALRQCRCDGGAWGQAFPPHPLSFGPGDPERSCGLCGWFQSGKGRNRGRCLHARLAGTRKTIAASTPSCNRFEPPLHDEDCGSCGACCHRGFSLVPVLPGDAILKLRPDWVVSDRWGRHIPRPDGKCLALQGDGATDDSLWRCRAYQDRPRHCRDFAAGSISCLEARRRAGIGP
jgi:hypothetical protein